MSEARLDRIQQNATPRSSSPQSNSGVPELDHLKWSKLETSDFDAGEGKDEGAVQDVAKRFAQSSILNRPLIRPAADAAGHLLPRGEKEGASGVGATGVPSAFFWINLAQRRAQRS